MKIIERLEDDKGKALVKCDQCKSESIGNYYQHKKKPDSFCRKCTMKNMNQSDSKRKQQSVKVDREVELKNKESNGLFILKFTDRRQKCIVRCIHCKEEYERLYKTDIYTDHGCKKCSRVKAADSCKKHSVVGHTHRLYNIFNSMMSRTGEYGNPDENYDGLKICQEWIDDRLKFFDWALENGYSEELSIDRINNDLGYYPENCRWTNQSIQSRNTKKIRKTNTSGYRGVSLSQTGLFRARIKAGKEEHLGTFKSAKLAAYHYDKYIIDNKLEHTRNFSNEEFSDLSSAIKAFD